MIGVLGQIVAGQSFSLLYQSSAETVISTIIACNTDASAREVHISILRLGENLNLSKQAIYAGFSLNPKASMTLTAGITLGPGDSVWVKSSADDVMVYTAFGESSEPEDGP